jgi:hypothetical protein
MKQQEGADDIKATSRRKLHQACLLTFSAFHQWGQMIENFFRNVLFVV